MARPRATVLCKAACVVIINVVFLLSSLVIAEPVSLAYGFSCGGIVSGWCGSNSTVLSEFWIPLITGDYAVVANTSNGLEFVGLVYGSQSTNRLYSVVSVGSDVYVIPVDADPRKFSVELFNVFYLAREGYWKNDYIPIIMRLEDLDMVETLSDRLEALGAERIDLIHRDLVLVSTRIPLERAGEIYDYINSIDGVRVWLDKKVYVRLKKEVLPSFGTLPSSEYRGSGVKVAIVSSGIDFNHPNFLSPSGVSRIVAMKSFVDGEDAYDYHGSGTFLAGVVAGVGGEFTYQYNTTYILSPGIAPGAELVVAKVLDRNGMGYLSRAIKAVEWAVDEGARVVLLGLETFDTYEEDPLELAVNWAFNSGAVVVAPSGDDGTYCSIVSPGSATGALTVAPSLGKSPYSAASKGFTRGGAIKPDVIAPGVGIKSSTPSGYGVYSGSCVAASYIAGVVAALLEKHPDLDPSSVKRIVASSADFLRVFTVLEQGCGVVDLNRTLNAVVVPEEAVYFVERAGESFTVNITLRSLQPVNTTLKVTVEYRDLRKCYWTPEERRCESVDLPSYAVSLSSDIIRLTGRGAASLAVLVRGSLIPTDAYNIVVKFLNYSNPSQVLSHVVIVGVKKYWVNISLTGREGESLEYRRVFVYSIGERTYLPRYVGLFAGEGGSVETSLPVGDYYVFVAEYWNGSEYALLKRLSVTGNLSVELGLSDTKAIELEGVNTPVVFKKLVFFSGEKPVFYVVNAHPERREIYVYSDSSVSGSLVQLEGVGDEAATIYISYFYYENVLGDRVVKPRFDTYIDVLLPSESRYRFYCAIGPRVGTPAFIAEESRFKRITITFDNFDSWGLETGDFIASIGVDMLRDGGYVDRVLVWRDIALLNNSVALGYPPYTLALDAKLKYEGVEVKGSLSDGAGASYNSFGLWGVGGEGRTYIKNFSISINGQEIYNYGCEGADSNVHFYFDYSRFATISDLDVNVTLDEGARRYAALVSIINLDRGELAGYEAHIPSVIVKLPYRLSEGVLHLSSLEAFDVWVISEEPCSSIELMYSYGGSWLKGVYRGYVDFARGWRAYRFSLKRPSRDSEVSLRVVAEYSGLPYCDKAVVNITLENAFRVSLPDLLVRVENAPDDINVSGLWVASIDNYSIGGFTDEEGVACIEIPGVGVHEFLIAGPLLNMDSEGLYATAELTVRGEGLHTVDLRETALGEVSISVLDENGLPISNGRLALQADYIGYPVECTVTDYEGSARVYARLGLRYDLWLHKSSWHSSYLYLVTNNTELNATNQFSVSGSKASITFSASSPWRLSDSIYVHLRDWVMPSWAFKTELENPVSMHKYYLDLKGKEAAFLLYVSDEAGGWVYLVVPYEKYGNATSRSIGVEGNLVLSLNLTEENVAPGGTLTIKPVLTSSSGLKVLYYGRALQLSKYLVKVTDSEGRIVLTRVISYSDELNWSDAWEGEGGANAPVKIRLPVNLTEGVYRVWVAVTPTLTRPLVASRAFNVVTQVPAPQKYNYTFYYTAKVVKGVVFINATFVCAEGSIIEGVEWRVDDEPVSYATALDGMFDSRNETVAVSFDAKKLSDGTHFTKFRFLSEGKYSQWFEVKVYVRTLKSGYNLISFRLQPARQLWASDLGEIVGPELKGVFRWSLEEQRYYGYIPGISPPERDFPIVLDYGYFLYLDGEAKLVEVEGWTG